MSWPRMADLWRLPLPGLDGPTLVQFTPDGSGLTFLQADPGSLVASLWHHDLVSGERSLVAAPLAESVAPDRLSRREQLERERRRTTALGVTDYAWLPGHGSGSSRVLVAMAGRAFVADGDRLHDGVRPIAGIEEAQAVVGSPDGSQVAFVRDGDIWVTAIDGGDPRRLTGDAEDGVANGLAEYAASEELDRFDGLWWSCDSRHIAYTRVDERGVPPVAIGHPGSTSPVGEEHRYPFAGGPNAIVSLRVVEATDAARGAAPVVVELPLRPGDYLARVVPHPGGGWLAAVLPRTQRELTWVRVAADGGSRTLWTEAADPWINLDNDTRILPDGRLLRSTERSGFRHLELRSPNGAEPTPLTTGEWSVTEVCHVDASAGHVYFQATAEDVTERHLYRVAMEPLAPVSRPERLTRDAGWHDVVFSADGSRWADSWSDLEAGPRLDVHATSTGLPRAGSAAPRSTVAAPRSTAARLGVRPPALRRVIAADGATELHAALYQPAAPAGSPPPCVVWVYGGPHQQSVKRAWEATVHALRQYLASAGVVVLVVDGRGSANRGLTFESPIAGALGTVEVQDQAAAVRQLAADGQIDPARVGITGGSYGGFMTLRAMALVPDLFRVGVAVAPVTSWDGYDTAYTERYLGRPEANPDAYARSSALELAASISGDLLVIHGAIDENVHLRHSTRLITALQAAGREVELVILPDDRHRIRSRSGLQTWYRRTVRHLLRGLDVPWPDELRAG